MLICFSYLDNYLLVQESDWWHLELHNNLNFLHLHLLVLKLPSLQLYTRLYLNRFRGEPAISGFVWPFTPIHNSSPQFSNTKLPKLKRYQRGIRIHCIVCPLIYGFWCPFGIFCPLYCLSFDLRIMIPLWYLLFIVLSVLWFTDSDTPLLSFLHCIVCPLIYEFWCPFGIFCPLYCLSFDLRIMIPKGHQNP